MWLLFLVKALSRQLMPRSLERMLEFQLETSWSKRFNAVNINIAEKPSLSTTMNARRSSTRMKSVISSLVFNRKNGSLISIWCRYYSHSIDQKRLWYYTASMHHLRAAISNSIWRCDNHWVTITIASFFHAAFKVTERCLMWISNVSSFDSMTLLLKTYQIQRWCWSTKSDWFTSWQNERIKIEVLSQSMR